MKYTILVLLCLYSIPRAQELNQLESRAFEKSDAGFYVPSCINYFWKGLSGVTERRDTFSYSAYGDVLYMESQEWKDGKWETPLRYFYEYDGKRNLIQYRSEIDQGDWYVNITDYKYDEKNRLTQTVLSGGYVDSIKFTLRYDKTYDDVKQTMEEIIKSWSGRIWLSTNKTLTKYDQNRKDTALIKYSWDSAKWILSSHKKNQYNSEGKLNSSLTYFYSETSGSVTTILKYEYYYTYEGKIKTTLSSYYMDGSWNKSEKEEYEYDGNGNIASYFKQRWNGSGWQNESRYSCAYDGSGNLIMKTKYKGDGDAWTNYFKAVCEYDSFNNAVHCESYKWTSGDWEIEDGSLYFGAREIFGSYGNATYIYINGSVGIYHELIQPDKFALDQNFPNPFNPETKISFSLPANGKASLKIYDMLGREIAELINGEMEKGTHTINFSGRNLSSGVYIYRLQSGSFTESKKMLLLK